jgi:hypothetical protein
VFSVFLLEVLCFQLTSIENAMEYRPTHLNCNFSPDTIPSACFCANTIGAKTVRSAGIGRWLETVRTPDGPRQRTICYLGELNDSAQAGWQKTIEALLSIHTIGRSAHRSQTRSTTRGCIVGRGAISCEAWGRWGAGLPRSSIPSVLRPDEFDNSSGRIAEVSCSPSVTAKRTAIQTFPKAP